MKRTIVFLASTPFLLAACSLATQGPPAGHDKMMTPFSCTESWTAPGLDIAAGLATIWLLLALDATDDSYDPTNAHDIRRGLVGTAIVGVAAVSAGIGIDRISKCSAARRALTLRQAEAAAALAARRRAADLIPVQKVLITGARDTMTVGKWTQLVATAYDSSGAAIVDKTFTWSSSNDTVAFVRPDGILEAEGLGTAMITANAGSVIGTVDVVVVPAVEREGATR